MARQPRPATRQTLCRVCHQSTSDVPRLILARGTVRGGTTVCFRCVATESGYEGLLPWLVEYLKSQADPLQRAREENAELRKQIARMQLSLEDANRLISKYK